MTHALISEVNCVACVPCIAVIIIHTLTTEVIIFGGDLSAGSPTDTLLRLSPPHALSVRTEQKPRSHRKNIWVT